MEKLFLFFLSIVFYRRPLSPSFILPRSSEPVSEVIFLWDPYFVGSIFCGIHILFSMRLNRLSLSKYGRLIIYKWGENQFIDSYTITQPASGGMWMATYMYLRNILRLMFRSFPKDYQSVTLCSCVQRNTVNVSNQADIFGYILDNTPPCFGSMLVLRR